MRIVQFSNGQYGIKKGFWIFTNFLSAYTDNWWNSYFFGEQVREYCMHSSLDHAERRLKRYMDPIRWSEEFDNSKSSTSEWKK